MVARDYKDVSAYGFCDGKFAFRQGVISKLTPLECERLFGFKDNYTRIPWRNKPAEECPDGHRYKALGNSMAVTVMRWIGERILIELNGLEE